jgi:hypothetical protein
MLAQSCNPRLRTVAARELLVCHCTEQPQEWVVRQETGQRPSPWLAVDAIRAIGQLDGLLNSLARLGCWYGHLRWVGGRLIIGRGTQRAWFPGQIIHRSTSEAEVVTAQLHSLE